MEHLGLVAGMYEELGIGEVIDRVIKQDMDQRQVSIGQAVKAMVLNGLGFANRRLYLTPHFFAHKPSEALIGEGVSADKLNDDTLGKALDALHGYGVSELYSLLAAQAVKRLGLEPKVGHQDTTSFHVDGKYNQDEAPDADAGIVHITHGYSRDSKPDLAQVALELIHEHQASLPVVLQVVSGNQNDKTTMQTSVALHVKQLKHVGIELLVKDSAGYSAGALQAHQEVGLKWVMPVPATLNEVKKLCAEVDLSKMEPLAEGYRYCKIRSNYGGIEQRWLVIASQASAKRAAKSVHRQLLQQTQDEQKAFAKLCRQEFHCAEDALQALQTFRQTLEVLEILAPQVIERRHRSQKGRPAAEALPVRVSYRLQANLAAPCSLRQQRIERASLFVLATNQLDQQALPDTEILQTYKGQSKVERGFRFLKDPMFLANTLYLKKVERIMALLMVMTICLLVYAALEHRIRSTLSKHQATIPDQKGKPTSNPTARWVFELFLDVHLLQITNHSIHTLTLNLKAELRSLLKLLGDSYVMAYP